MTKRVIASAENNETLFAYCVGLFRGYEADISNTIGMFDSLHHLPLPPQEAALGKKLKRQPCLQTREVRRFA